VPDGLIGDAGRIRQVLVNIVGNALKFTERGEIVVRVQPESLGDGEMVLRVSVSDTGPGIRPDRLDAIFEPFTQADGSVTRKFGGTGLGLTISRRLVHLMDGRLWGESTEGRGSTFHFTARLGRCAAGLGTGAKVQAAPVKATGPTTRRKRVLIAEDNLVNQRVAARFLENLGYRVHVVADGRSALDALGCQPFDLVLMDVQMPGMDGLETTAELRRREQDTGGRRVPVIALTAHAMQGDRERCRGAGMDGYLSKPVQAAELRAIVDTILGRDEPMVFDRAALLAIIGGDWKTLRELAALFLREQPGVLAAARQALAGHDLPSLTRAAHSLKGMLGSMSAPAAMAAAARLEALARHGDADQVPAAFAALEASLVSFSEELAAVLR
jgi:CheY-like chemotaxis protein/anti-sigma regulatory factor (Ser/Thr protein kinase)